MQHLGLKHHRARGRRRGRDRRCRLPTRTSRGQFSIASGAAGHSVRRRRPDRHRRPHHGREDGEILGQTFIVENRAGAGGNIGADFVAKATPDGYTLLFATVSTNAINPGLYKHMPYDAVKDFTAVARVGVTPTLLMVNPSIPATDVKSLVALLKANPGKYDYGSSGVGSILHLCGEEFKAMVGSRHRARALQRLGADGHRSDGRPNLDGLRRDADRAAAVDVRQASTRSAPGCSSAFPPCRICRPWTNRA